MPFLGATAIYSAFGDILSSINQIWSLKDPDQRHIRNPILGACFNVSVSQRIGMQFLCMINILVLVTAPQTAVTILKMIAGVTIIHERLFWEQRENESIPLNTSGVEKVIDTFRRSDSRTLVAHQIDGHRELQEAMVLRNSQAGSQTRQEFQTQGVYLAGDTCWYVVTYNGAC